MKELNLKKVVGVLGVVALLLGISAAYLVMGEESSGRKKPPSRSFSSDNGKYIVTVEYEDWYGKGRAKYILKDKSGKIIWRKVQDLAPLLISVSNDAQSIVAFGGGWRDLAYIAQIAFYDYKGNLLKKHDLRVPLNFESGFSEDGKLFFLNRIIPSKEVKFSNEVMAFNLQTGNIEWRQELDGGEPRRIISSKNGEWILTSVSRNKTRQFYLFDRKGKKHWQKEFTNAIAEISERGDHLVFTTRDKKLTFRNEEGKIKLEREEMLKEPWGKRKKEE